MTTHATLETLKFPFPAPPKTGEVIEVRPGIFWARLALPFRLDHVNIYFIEDGDGLALIDTGIDNAASRAAWEALISGPLAGRKLTRIIATHFHPDHIGLAGWLCERFDLGLAMSQTEYLIALNIRLDPQGLRSEPYRGFYRSHGLSEESTEILLGHGLDYLRMVSTPPRTFQRLIAEDRIAIGGRAFEVMTGAGHSPEQVMLYSAEDHLILSGDQILAKISPNVSVEAMDPDGDPLGLYLRSLERLKRTLPQDVLVLPGHNLPFVGLSDARGRAHRPSRGALSGHRGSLQGRAANRRRAGAGHFRPADRRPAPARVRLRRGARACQRDDPRRAAARRQLRAGAGARGGVRHATRPIGGGRHREARSAVATQCFRLRRRRKRQAPDGARQCEWTWEAEPLIGVGKAFASPPSGRVGD